VISRAGLRALARGCGDVTGAILWRILFPLMSNWLTYSGNNFLHLCANGGRTIDAKSGGSKLPLNGAEFEPEVGALADSALIFLENEAGLFCPLSLA